MLSWNSLVSTRKGVAGLPFSCDLMMRRFLLLPLRRQLFLLLMVLVLPALVGIFYMFTLWKIEAEKDSGDETREVTSFLMSEQQQIVSAAQQIGRVMANLSEVRNRDASTVKMILSDIIRIHPHYLNIVVADRDGNVWASALYTKNPVNIADRRYFRACKKDLRFSSGEYSVGKITGKPSLNFGYPILDSRGEFDGVIAFNYDLDFYFQLLRPPANTRKALCFLLDHRGVILFSSERYLKYAGRDDREDLYRRMVNGPEEDTFTEVGLDGVKRVISYRKFTLEGEETPYLFARVSIPVRTVADTFHPKQFHLILMALLSILSLGIVYQALTCSFVKRINILREASNRMAGGDLSVRVADSLSGGELGELGRAFDSMARQLAARENAQQKIVKELIKNKKKYRALFYGANDAIYVHPILADGMPGTFIEVNDHACKMLGYTRMELLQLSPFDIDDPAYRGNIPSIGKRLIENGYAVFETAHVARDGRMIPMEVSARLLNLEGDLLVYSICRDITKRNA